MSQPIHKSAFSPSSYSLEEHSSSSGSGSSARATKNSSGSQETLDGDCSDIFKATPSGEDHDFVEEIGVDMTEDFDPNSSDPVDPLDGSVLNSANGETIIDKMLTFNIPGEDLQGGFRNYSYFTSV